MFSAGVQNPRLGFLICIGVTAVAFASITWGVLEMQAVGQETLGSGLKIGLAMLPAIMGPLMASNFWRGMKVFAAVRRGENAIARWTVTVPELVEFSIDDKMRNAAGMETLNDWTPPREPTSSDIDVVFVADGVLVGDTYFALVTTGLFRFSNVWMQAGRLPTVAFRTFTTYANRFSTRTTMGELRIPVSRLAGEAAVKVVTHFERVGAREVIVNPGFYRSRMRFGLIAAPICFAIAALGYVLDPNGLNGDISAPVIMLAGGIVLGIGALVLAVAAKLMDSAQRGKR